VKKVEVLRVTWIGLLTRIRIIFMICCRKPLDHPISDSDQRRVKEFFQNCEDGSKTLYYHL
jgi:hypothetical protein